MHPRMPDPDWLMREALSRCSRNALALHTVRQTSLGHGRYIDRRTAMISNRTETNGTMAQRPRDGASIAPAHPTRLCLWLSPILTPANLLAVLLCVKVGRSVGARRARRLRRNHRGPLPIRYVSRGSPALRGCAPAAEGAWPARWQLEGGMVNVVLATDRALGVVSRRLLCPFRIGDL